MSDTIAGLICIWLISGALLAGLYLCVPKETDFIGAIGLVFLWPIILPVLAMIGAWRLIKRAINE